MNVVIWQNWQAHYYKGEKYMRTLYIVRHGKSSWEMPGITDIDRTLLDVGISNSYLMAERLVISGAKIDLIISSNAVRAIHTALILARGLKVKGHQIIIDEIIYSGECDDILHRVSDIASEINNVMIVGHNPVFTDLANKFLSKPIDNLPTSGIVTLTFNSSGWGINGLQPTAWSFDSPKKE